MFSYASGKSKCLYLAAGKKGTDAWRLFTLERRDLRSVASWYCALAPERHLEAKPIEEQLKIEFDLAKKVGFPDYWMLTKNKRKACFVTGWLPAMEEEALVAESPGKEYKCKLFLNPLLSSWKKLYEPAFRTLLGYLFQDPSIGKVLVDLDESDREQRWAMEQLGFHKISSINIFFQGHSWYACLSQDFRKSSGRNGLSFQPGIE